MDQDDPEKRIVELERQRAEHDLSSRHSAAPGDFGRARHQRQ